jgi:hypothetical protein
LTTKFANLQEGDPVTPQDKVMWEYFASLYKNSNKGIKGRGKDRRISTVPSSASSTTSSNSFNSPRNASNHASQAAQDDRSRSSSYSTDETMTEAPRTTQESYQGFEEHGGWSNSVFPERKMF